MKKKTLPTQPVSAICSAKGCTRMAIRATRLSDFWMSECEFHSIAMTLDITKTVPKVKGKARK